MKRAWRKLSAAGISLALIVGMFTIYSAPAYAESWTFADGGAADGLNYDASKSATAPSLQEFNGELYLISIENSLVRVKKHDRGLWVSADGNASLNKSASKTAEAPVMAVYNNELYAAWHELSTGSPSVRQIRVKKFDGADWTFVDGDAAGGLNQNTAFNARTPQLAAMDDKLCAVWAESTSTVTQIRAKCYDGVSWVSIDGDGATGLNKDVGKVGLSPDVAVLDHNLYAAWYEKDSNGTEQIRVKRYDGSGWAFVDGDGATGLNKDPTQWATGPKLAVYANKLYAAWIENSGGISQIRVIRYDEPGWSFVDGNGPNGISANGTANAFAPQMAAFDSKLYLIWHEGPTPNQIRLKKYDGSDWESADGGGVLGINKDTSDSATNAFPKLYDGKLFATWLEYHGSADQVRVAFIVSSNTAPTATGVVIGGSAKIGQTLEGEYAYGDAESDPENGSTYRWYAADDDAGTGKTAIDGATSDSYAPTVEVLGKYIYFEVTPGADEGTTPGISVTSPAVGPVEVNAAPTATGVAISGTAKVGQILTGTYAYSDMESDAESGTLFQWFAADDAAGNGMAAIDGATASTYTLTAAEVGKSINLKVTPVAATGTVMGEPAVAISAAGPVQANTPPIVPSAPTPEAPTLPPKVTITDAENGQLKPDSTLTQIIGADLKLSGEIRGADGKPLAIGEIAVAANGSFKVPNLPAGTYSMTLQVVAPTGEKLAGRTAKLTIDANGNAALDAELIDPYGIVSDELTGRPLAGVKLSLHWSDTALNRSKNRKPGDLAVLPELPDFAPNRNHDPQTSTIDGQYGWMVFPDGDYYIVAEKEGYETFDSRNDPRAEQHGDDSYIREGIIHVGVSIVQYDLRMKPKVVETGMHRPYMNGYGDGSFRPDLGITRAELATILLRAYPLTDEVRNESGNTGFTDVPSAHWAAEAIRLAGERGWMKGYPDGRFEAGRTVTRAEMAQILANVKHWAPGAASEFPDAAGHWALTAIASARQAGILAGYADGTFRPDSPVTRAEAAAAFNKLLGRVPRQAGGSPSESPGWSDVPSAHWAYADILEAAATHAFDRYANGVELWK